MMYVVYVLMYHTRWDLNTPTGAKILYKLYIYINI